MGLSATFAALSDPTRRDVVARLKRGDATVSHLARGHAMSLPAFSKHVGVLVDAGLVERRKVGRTMVCSLTPGRLEEAEAWIADLRSFWTGGLGRLDDLLAADPSVAPPSDAATAPPSDQPSEQPTDQPNDQPSDQPNDQPSGPMPEPVPDHTDEQGRP